MDDNTILADLVTKKRSGSKTIKGTSGKLMSKDLDIDDGTKLALKDEATRKTAGKSRAEKYNTNTNKPGGSADNLRAEEVGEPKSAITKKKGEYSVSKKSKPSGHLMLNKQEDVAERNILKGAEVNLRTPMKWKRGADGEIIEAYLLSLERNLSRFRPRKEVPNFRMVDLAESDSERIVGKRLKVYWPESRRWFTGCIQAFDRRKKLHSILYEDGDNEELDLWKERFELEIMPSESFNLRVVPNSKKKVSVLDALKVSAGALTEESAKVGDTENVTALKSSEGSLGTLQSKMDGEKGESDRDMENVALVR